MRLQGLVLMSALAVVLAGCGGGDEQKGGGGGPPAVVTTAVLQPSEWHDGIEALGTARARDSVTITAKVSETVEQVKFDSGEQVRAGQPLVVLSGKAQRAELAEAQARYAEAQRLYERQQDLAKRQLIAASQFDIQRAARDASKAQLDQVRAQISDRAIVAPFAGTLGLRQVSPGSLVTPGTVITTLDDLSTMELDFSVPERFLSALSVGQAIGAQTDAYADQTFVGRISSLDPRIDPVSRAITIRAEIANPDGRLRPGMLLRVSVALPGRQALQVPEIALQQVGQQAFLFVVGADNKVEQVAVRIGQRKPGAVEILEGVKAGDRIVVEGTVKLRGGSEVKEATATDAKPDADGKPAAGA